MTTYKIMTCNLLTDSLYDWGDMAFQKRSGAILQMIAEEQPDLIGMQEFTAHMETPLGSLLETYGYTGEKRSPRFAEANPVLWRKDRFDVSESGTLWLSATPEKTGSRHFGSQFARIVTYAVLRDKKTNQTITFFNTHLDLYFPFVRLKQVKTLLSLIKEKGQGEIFLTGDFNETSRGKGIQTLRETFRDAVPDSFGSTLRGKTGSTVAHHLPVDHIFYSAEATCLKVKKIRRKFNGIPPSDHYPVIAEFLI